ncbi:hypothetical protein CsatB_002621 [Cannabis sativa]|uniref:Uncharacterized protein n=2 Tax=Cannabis sativa TaxID=3483 RepID=A0AB40E5G3_CANSA|nr:uncharacterized protein LOC115716792 isoform X1 [Cannabis sativa]KAF4399106.1 hypothetical protein G4B88_023700 [Cannabis sativa]
MGGGGGGHLLKRIPRIKFPDRHPKPSSSVSAAETQEATSDRKSAQGSDVRGAPHENTLGGKASLQPRRTPVSDKEIEAIMLGGSF